MDMKPTGNNLIYLYCLNELTPKLKEVDHLVEKLYFIYHRGLYAVVSLVSKDKFCEENLKTNLNNMEWLEKKVYIHEGIIQGIMKNTWVIPFKFATLFNTVDSLKACLEQNAAKFKENLKYLKGKEEWGVKIYCETERLKESLIREDKEFLMIDKEINSSTPGKVFFLTKMKDELLKNKLDNKIIEYVQNSFERLREQSLEASLNKLSPQKTNGQKSTVISNSVFLVDKNQINSFINIVNILKEEYENDGVSLDCTGPWPPYNFCA